MRLEKFDVTASAACGVLTITLCVFASPAVQAQDTSLPTGLQAPLPATTLPLPRGEKALPVSPDAAQLNARLGAKPLTIDEIVSLALSTNRDLALAVENLSQLTGQTTTAKANLLPGMSAGYTLNRYNQAQTADFNGQSITIQPQYSSQASVNFSLPVDLTGEIHAAVSQAQFQEIAARLDVNRVRNEVVLKVKSAFYDVLRDKALVDVSQNSLQNTVDRLADAKLRLAAGTAALYDVLSAQTDVANARKTVIQNQTTLSQALLALNNAVGINTDTQLKLTTEGAVETPPEIASSFTDPTPHSTAEIENTLTGKEGEPLGDSGAAKANQVRAFVVSPPISPGDTRDYDHLLDEALHTRAEIIREDANIAAAKKGILVARQGLLPKTSLGYSYTFNPNPSALGGQQQTGEATLSFTLPLFDGGAARGKVRTAKAQIATSETNRRTAVDTVTMEVREAYLNLQQAQEQVAATREELALADEAYRLARLRYSTGITKQAGISPIIELSDSQKALAQAQSDYVNALYDYNSNRSSLDKAAGRYSYTSAGPGYAAPNKVR